MSNVSFDINSDQLEEVLDKLSGKEMMQAQKRALSGAGRLLFKATKQNVAAKVPNSRKPNPKYSDTLYDGVRMSVFQEDYIWYFKVHILGTRKKTSGTYRLRFFEGGTEPRKTRHAYTDKLGRRYPAGQNRGRLRAYNFFSSAVSTTQTEVVTAIEENLMKEIKNITQDNT